MWLLLFVVSWFLTQAVFSLLAWVPAIFICQGFLSEEGGDFGPSAEKVEASQGSSLAQGLTQSGCQGSHDIQELNLLQMTKVKSNEFKSQL